MWSAWGIFGMIQLLTNRYLKRYWKYVMWVHRIAGTLILLITMVLGIYTIGHGGWEVE
jgi:hypothetical protein